MRKADIQLDMHEMTVSVSPRSPGAGVVRLADVAEGEVGDLVREAKILGAGLFELVRKNAPPGTRERRRAEDAIEDAAMHAVKALTGRAPATKTEEIHD